VGSPIGEILNISEGDEENLEEQKDLGKGGRWWSNWKGTIVSKFAIALNVDKKLDEEKKEKVEETEKDDGEVAKGKDDEAEEKDKDGTADEKKMTK